MFGFSSWSLLYRLNIWLSFLKTVALSLWKGTMVDGKYEERRVTNQSNMQSTASCRGHRMLTRHLVVQLLVPWWIRPVVMLVFSQPFFHSRCITTVRFKLTACVDLASEQRLTSKDFLLKIVLLSSFGRAKSSSTFHIHTPRRGYQRDRSLTDSLLCQICCSGDHGSIPCQFQTYRSEWKCASVLRSWDDKRRRKQLCCFDDSLIALISVA